jgi:hypothetical protein
VAADTALTGVAEKVWCGADFAASDDLVDVHGGLSFEVSGGVRRSLFRGFGLAHSSCRVRRAPSPWARHFCPTHVNRSARG